MPFKNTIAIVHAMAGMHVRYAEIICALFGTQMLDAR